MATVFLRWRHLTPELAFLDLKNYLAPNYSLALFLEDYGTTEMKGSFPYEMVKGVTDLFKPGLPSRMNFYPSLQGETISAEAYFVIEQARCSNEMSKLFDLLKCYLLLDVRPFLEAVLVYLGQYKETGLDLFKTAIRLLSISLN